MAEALKNMFFQEKFILINPLKRYPQINFVKSKLEKEFSIIN